RYRGQVVSSESGNVFVRLAQHGRYRDAAFRLAFARDLVLGKLDAGRRLLKQYRHNHPEEAGPLQEAIGRLGEGLLRAQAAPGVDILRGVEGAAAAAY